MCGASEKKPWEVIPDIRQELKRDETRRMCKRDGSASKRIKDKGKVTRWKAGSPPRASLGESEKRRRKKKRG